MPLLRLSLVVFFLLLLQNARATHIRAGQITAVRDSTSPATLTYIFTLTLYRDTKGVTQPDAILVFAPLVNGERRPPIGEVKVDVNSPSRIIGPEIEELTYTFRYTFSGPGEFVVYYKQDNRNGDVVNMNNSLETPFYVETIIQINPALGFNNTPRLRNPPIDNAEVGQRFCHNPAAFDLDGDSLGYRMVVPRQNVNLPVNGYRSPETVGPPPGTPESGSGTPTFTINPFTGEVCWDAPGPFGVGSKGYAEYNIAFVVEEWRRTSVGFIKIGEVVRDMQITVRDQPNKRPRLQIPNDTCIVAGTTLRAVIRATDPDTDQQVRISSESAIFATSRGEFPFQPAATLNPPNHPPRRYEQYVYQGNPAASQFAWATVCGQVRAQPFDVVFKAEDNAPRPNQLTDTRTWRITVVGPPPVGLQAQAEGRGIRLNWTRYACANASQILIWRRVGCSPDEIGPCVRPPLPGYVLVGRVAAGTTTFLDTRVQRGLQYAYRLTAGFAAPGLGFSQPSAFVCARLKLDVPLITKVSVTATDRTAGTIDVEWAQPLELDKTAFPGPYRYDVYRATGFTRGFGPSPANSQPVASIPASTDPAFYLRFTDRSLNTEDNPYTYVVLLYSGGTLVDSSRTASSVRLSAQPLPNAIRLDWRAEVPWDNTNQRHTVFRQNRQTGQFAPLATVAVAGTGTFTYTNTGLANDSVYCYRVETVGSYNEPLIRTPLRNFSQEICTTPLDTIKPCAVTLAIDGTDCELWAGQEKQTEQGGGRPDFCRLTTFANHLTWTYPAQEGAKVCRETDVLKYRVYFKRHEEDEQFTLIDSVLEPVPPAKEYFHRNLTSYAGMYYVTAVDRSGNESAPSNIVSKDNCPYYKLPNVITPDNGDTLNQVFKPYPCPRFIESGKVTLVNRWGRPVFETTDIQVNWSGRLNVDAESAEANTVSPGVYYYSAELKTLRLRRRDERIVVKGWVQILR